MTLESFRYLLAVMVLAAGVGTASAQQSVTYVLDQTNVAGLTNGTSFLDVTLMSPTAGTVDVTVTPVYPFITGSNFGIQDFYLNYSGTSALSAIGFSSLPSGWSAAYSPPPLTADGFGKYMLSVDNGGSNRQSSLTFALTNLGGSTEAQTLSYLATLSTGNAGNGNQYFAAHLADFTVGTTTGDSGYFAGQTLAVPEPQAYALMLAGLGGIGLLHGRRRKLQR